MDLKNACVEVCDSRSMHVLCWVIMNLKNACDEVGAQFYLLIVFLMSGGRGREMVFSYKSIP